jgi:ribosomal protein S18 acetylase RimI-like enzyme
VRTAAPPPFGAEVIDVGCENGVDWEAFEPSGCGMSQDGLIIRRAVVADADAMGRLHVRAWQSAYRAVMPDEYLDGLDPNDRISMWHARLARSDLPPLLVGVVDEEVVGFATWGAAPPPESAGVGELYAINVDPVHWGKGIGRALLRASTAALAVMGFDEAILWVVPENGRARALYQSEGWLDDGATSTEDILGVTVTDMRLRKALRQ